MLSILRKTRTFSIIGSHTIHGKEISTASQTFEIVISEGEKKKINHDKGFDILLFGYMASPLKYLQKHSMMYNSVGYRFR